MFCHSDTNDRKANHVRRAHDSDFRQEADTGTAGGSELTNRLNPW